MSYGSGAALQAAVYQALAGDAAVAAAVGSAIYDAVPAGTLPDLYISLGVEQATAVRDQGGAVVRHQVVVSVLSDDAGFARAKELAADVSDALDGAALTLDRGRLLSLGMDRARARRADKNRKRRIDLRFVALVDAG